MIWLKPLKQNRKEVSQVFWVAIFAVRLLYVSQLYKKKEQHNTTEWRIARDFAALIESLDGFIARYFIIIIQSMENVYKIFSRCTRNANTH